MKSIKRLAAMLVLASLLLCVSGCAQTRQSGPYSVYLISKSTQT